MDKYRPEKWKGFWGRLVVHKIESKLIALANIVPTILLGIKRGTAVHSF